MLVDIPFDEHQMMVSLVAGRIQEIRREIRRSMSHTYRSGLKAELATWRRLHARLLEAGLEPGAYETPEPHHVGP